MPIKIQNKLPAQKVLETENIFVMTQDRAESQDVRALKIIILNLMPTKIDTETQFLRLLGNTPLQVDVDLMQTVSHKAKNISSEHLTKFYKSLDEVKDENYDGMIITGAPVEKLDFENVDYWDELCDIMKWADSHVYSVMNVCWGAQASLYYHYGIQKHMLDEKLFGVFNHRMVDVYHPLLRGFDDNFYIPHSRHTTVKREDIEKVSELVTLAVSNEAGVAVCACKSGRRFFVMGHPEYDRMTLANEYFRDYSKGLKPEVPFNYFPENKPSIAPLFSWRSHASLLFQNWLNYYVYQQTPYDLRELEKLK